MVDGLRLLFGPGLLALFLIVLILFLILARRNPTRDLREIPAFHRLKRMVGLAVEAGTRLHVAIGRGQIFDLPGASAFAGLSMLDRITRAASISERPPIASAGDGLLGILAQNTQRSTQEMMGVDVQHESGAGQVAGLTPFSYAAGAMSIIHDCQVSANLLAGHFGAEAALLAEAAEQSGSVTLGGSDSLQGQAVIFASAQESLIGEDLYAGAAYLGGGMLHLASLKAQDVLRWVLVAGMILSAVMKFLGMW